MKRTAGAIILLAALGGGCMTQQSAPDLTTGNFNRAGVAREIPGLVGPWGQPVAVQSDGTAAPVDGDVTPVVARGSSPDSVAPATTGAKAAAATSLQQVSATGKVGKAVASEMPKEGVKQKLRTGHVPPPPPAGPPGAVAAIPGPALPGGLPLMGTARSSVRFVGQDGMRIAWFAPLADGKLGFKDQLETPGRYNFLQGGIYRLRLSNIPKRPALFLYPTIQVEPQNPKTTTFLAHSAIPLSFTDDDFEQVVSGNFVVKVIYLPDPQFQDLAVAGPDEIVSTRLEPGVDPIQEAQRRGSVLLIVRMGNIDLETQGTPAMDSPNPYLRPPVPPGFVPPPAKPVPPPVKPPATLPGATPKLSSSELPMPKPSGSVILP